jgi:excisionase family DNA binding protein
MTQLLNVENVAIQLAISPWTVRSLLRTGRLRPLRVGRRVLVEESELQRFVEEARKSQASIRESSGETQQ